MKDCLFCGIIAGDIPCTKVYEDECVYAFLDIAPATPVHVLVVPKAHLSGADEVTEETAPLLGHIFTVIPKIAKMQGITDYRVVTNQGESAGQTVRHLHFHLLGGRELHGMG